MSKLIKYWHTLNQYFFNMPILFVLNYLLQGTDYNKEPISLFSDTGSLSILKHFHPKLFPWTHYHVFHFVQHTIIQFGNIW